MRLQKRKVLLLLDNFSGHGIAYDPTNVRIEFLAPNMTSRIQPLDAGIIRAFKAHYRRAFCMRALDADEAGDEDIWKLNLWQAMNMARDAWNEITETTIRNCWAHTGILPSAAPATSSSAPNQAASPSSASTEDAAWAFLLEFISNDMTLPQAQHILENLLGSAAKEDPWKKALALLNDVEPDDTDAQIAAQQAVEKLRAASRPSRQQATPMQNPTPVPSEAERDLHMKIKQLAERKLIRNALTIDEFLDPAEERQIGEGVHELQTDEQIVAAVRAEAAIQAAGPAGAAAAESDEDSDDDDPAAHLPLETIIKLCDQLEAACVSRGVDNVLALRTELLKVKRELRQTQLHTAKQLTIDTFLGHADTRGAASDVMDVDSDDVLSAQPPVV